MDQVQEQIEYKRIQYYSLANTLKIEIAQTHEGIMRNSFKSVKVLAAVLILQYPLIVKFVSITGALGVAPIAMAQSGPEQIADLSPAGWQRSTELLGLNIDSYRPASGVFDLYLIAFPATDQSASDWIDALIPLLAKESDKPDNAFHIMSAEDVSVELAKDGEDTATRLIMVIRPGKSRGSLFLVVRSIVRKGEPVQFSMMTLSKTQDEDDRKAADEIALAARLPVNQSAAILGLPGMFQLMTNPLLYPEVPAEPDKVAQDAAKRTNTDTKPETPEVIAEAAAVPASKQTNVLMATSYKSSAAPFYKIPGPRVKLTGGMLGALPAGYRMQLNVTNYWVSGDQMSTRQKHLALTADGQFEKSHFSINGSMSGLADSAFAGDKNGSTGSVYGNTNPGGEGARSVALSRREGLDPKMYGTYFISGKAIELLYADGSSEKLSFVTDGYSEILLDNKRYFNVTANGWEKKTNGKMNTYRSLDGAYLVNGRKVHGNLSNSKKWVQDYLGRLITNDKLISAGPLQTMRVGKYSIVKVSLVLKNGDGKASPLDFYLRVHDKTASFTMGFNAIRYKGAKGDADILKLIAGVYAP